MGECSILNEVLIDVSNDIAINNFIAYIEIIHAINLSNRILYLYK